LYDKDKNRIFTEASLFILPSYSENFVAGLPVITTNKTPWTNLQQRGCGWTISDSIEELSDALYKATHTSHNKLHKMVKLEENGC